MIKIGFCDDEISALNEFRVLIDKYRQESSREIFYITFNSPLELLAEIERGARYDVLFLDVLMPGENGIDAAKEIRKYDGSVKIIYLTSSSEFAVESYTVGAYFYQLKPICKDSFFRLMDSVLLLCEKEHADSLILRCKDGITRIELRYLEYCEVMHRTIFLHLTTGKVLESVGSLDGLSSQLMPYGKFIRPHRSYLVNMEHVQSISYRSITMSCLTEIPIPRGKYNEIKNAFLEYAFRDGQATV